MTNQRAPSGFGRIIVGLLLFGIAFGYVEAAVVVYLRSIYDPMRHQLHPQRPLGELFPLIRLGELQQLDRRADPPSSRYEFALTSNLHRLKIELGRELATLILLAAAALLVARNFNEWIAAFILTFGIWDIFYYVFLKLLIDWPASLMTWDILFLLPLPWVGPVIAPILVAATMVVAGTLLLSRERAGKPVAFAPWHWGIIIAGGFIIVCSFCWDYRNLLAGGYPSPFNWPLYLAGLLIGVTSLAMAYRRGAPPTSRAR